METPNTSAQGSDICACGDFRSQHKPDGKCGVCFGMRGDYNGCTSFRFAHAADTQDALTWSRYHASRVALVEMAKRMGL